MYLEFYLDHVFAMRNKLKYNYEGKKKKKNTQKHDSVYQMKQNYTLCDMTGHFVNLQQYKMAKNVTT